MPPKKKTEAQIARQKAKDAKKKQVLKEQIKKDHAEAGAAPGENKAKEEAVILPKLKELKLQTVPTKPDGDCLFSSLIHQLQKVGPGSKAATTSEGLASKIGNSSIAMRKILSDFMKVSPESFGLYIVAEDVGLSAADADDNKKKVEKYAENMSKNSETWGGHLEIVAAASVFDVDIAVINDATTQIVCPVGCEDQKQQKQNDSRKRWTIVWWQHRFALGAHYEATAAAGEATVAEAGKKNVDNDNDDEDESEDDE